MGIHESFTSFTGICGGCRGGFIHFIWFRIYGSFLPLGFKGGAEEFYLGLPGFMRFLEEIRGRILPSRQHRPLPVPQFPSKLPLAVEAPAAAKPPRTPQILQNRHHLARSRPAVSGAAVPGHRRCPAPPPPPPGGGPGCPAAPEAPPAGNTGWERAGKGLFGIKGTGGTGGRTRSRCASCSSRRNSRSAARSASGSASGSGREPGLPGPSGPPPAGDKRGGMGTPAWGEGMEQRGTPGVQGMEKFGVPRMQGMEKMGDPRGTADGTVEFE